MGFNRCPFQLLRSYKTCEKNKSKKGQERSSIQQAGQCQQPSMNARKCVHAQNPHPTQAFAHESSTVGRRGKREEKTEARRLIERKVAQQNKDTSEELKQGLTKRSSGKQSRDIYSETCIGD